MDEPLVILDPECPPDTLYLLDPVYIHIEPPEIYLPWVELRVDPDDDG